ncbi:DUF6600 domain-containing protein [Pedobacter sp.]|uniref:DUF6600 domain-containing protein n=1 Tax=Pedobacter sp. TaxID=1411316 RepID=UPI00396CB0A6
MKRTIKFPAILLGLMLLLFGTTQRVSAQYEDVSLQSFYDELSPYGIWINDPDYGYVWRPDVDQSEFRPYYSNGRWVMTEYGNTWVSNYDWGWAPFHYGRWVYNRYNSWIWIPDTVWGPAWVTWRSGGGYYGWAPMGPSVNINISFGRPYRLPDFCWNFIPQRDIYYSSFPRYYSRRNTVYIQNTVIINNTYVRNNRTYYTGPRADDIRRVTNRDVTVYNINRNSRTGGSRIENNTVNIYNPRPARGSANTDRQPAPSRVVNASINRDVIDRSSRVVATRESRGNEMMNREGRERTQNVDNEQSRNPRQDNGNMNRGREMGNPSVNEQPQRIDRTTNGRGQMVMPPQEDRSASPQTRAFPQRVERTERTETQRMERPQPRMEAPQPQRIERSQPRMEAPQPQRVERSQSGNSSRGESSRPSRGEGRSGRG